MRLDDTRRLALINGIATAMREALDDDVERADVEGDYKVSISVASEYVADALIANPTVVPR